jgi:uroporphyrinogen-III synthase
LRSSTNTFGEVVFLTREESKNDKLGTSLHNLGIQTYELPLVEHTRNKAGMEKLVRLLKDEAGEGSATATITTTTTWFVTTSPEAALVFTDCWREAGCPSAVNIASIGLGTTRALEENGAGDLIRFTPSKATGKVLARELPFHCLSPESSEKKHKEEGEGASSSSLVVYPSSELASNDVEEGLSKRGFTVERVNTYSTRPVESLTKQQAEAASKASIVTFGSPSAIRAWKHLVNKTDILCCCIGGTSHKACLKNGFQEGNIFSPSKPGLEGWSKVVVDALDQQKKASKT